MKNLLLAAIAATTLSACTWVQLTTEGENVSLLAVDRISNCERIGRATAKTLGKIVTIQRGGERLQEELLTLARNEAGRMGGNTVVPESLIDGGEQDFGVYNCLR
ncbi:MAG: DUF4156 domain-containing protein [Gammaproteobacteria bacterium]|nr:DUF4156 domain-containing protein [Gammaproteobacteria bacterium]